jgi:hypothetical protein
MIIYYYYLDKLPFPLPITSILKPTNFLARFLDFSNEFHLILSENKFTKTTFKISAKNKVE